MPPPCPKGDLRPNSSNTTKNRPNRDLTPSERSEKQRLKARLRENKNRTYWEGRIRFAIKCKDDEKERRARYELKRLEEKRDRDDRDGRGMTSAEDGKQAPPSINGSNNIASESADDDAPATASPLPNRGGGGGGATFVQRIYDELVLSRRRRADERGLGDEVSRRADTSLLKHMRRGTQRKSMFVDAPDALWGYAITKFVDRASLVVSSLSKLESGGSGRSERPRNGGLSWIDRISCVSTACSIGSGPGADAAGIVSFLQCRGRRDDVDEDNYDARDMDPTPPPLPRLEEIMLLDFAVEEWRAVTDPLALILVPMHVRRLTRAPCDVTEPLEADVNRRARCRLLPSSSTATGSGFDMFLVSYVLTETHGLWEAFLSGVIDSAKRGALFYFAEPNPWQLHRLTDLFGRNNLDLVWIDSSFRFPELRGLGTREGPAVLLGVKQ